MNPFNKILEATSLETNVDSYAEITTNNTTNTTTSSYHDNKTNEVHQLIKQLQNIIGNFDTSEIFDILANLSNDNNTCSKLENNNNDKYVNNVKFDKNLINDKKLFTLDEGELSSPESDNLYKQHINNYHPSIRSIPEIENNNIYRKSSNIHNNLTSIPSSSSSNNNRKSLSYHGYTQVVDGNNILYRESSRYSLGVNRFSMSASKLSMDTLNYINKDKILNASSRTPSKTSVSSVISSTIQQQQQSQRQSNNKSEYNLNPKEPLNNTQIIDDNHNLTTTYNTNISNELFTEFCEIGVSAKILDGIDILRMSTLQPTMILDSYPEKPFALINNIHEYCFPNGAQLNYCTKKEFDVLRNTSSSTNSLKYQIMQYTDESHTTFYAASIISIEPLYDISLALITNLNDLMEFIAAANIIKRHIRYYLFRSKRRISKELDAVWSKSIDINRRQSTSSIVTIDSQGNEGVSGHRYI